jgi:hypothetical protein
MSSPSLPSPFTINVPDAVLRDLAGRLPRTRFPERTTAPWRAGTDPAEALNAQLNALITRARGFRSAAALIAMAEFAHGGLCPESPY